MHQYLTVEDCKDHSKEAEVDDGDNDDIGSDPICIDDDDDVTESMERVDDIDGSDQRWGRYRRCQ